MAIRRATVTGTGDTRAVSCPCGYAASGPAPSLHECRLTPPCGPGCQLSRLLAWWGVGKAPGCRCAAHAAQMDAWGVDVCQQHLTTILGWLREEAGSRGLPWLDAVGRLFVQRAIDAARREANGQEAEAQRRATDVGSAE